MRFLMISLLLIASGCDSGGDEKVFDDTELRLDDISSTENLYNVLYSTGTLASKTGKRITEIRHESEWQSFLMTEPELANNLRDTELNFVQGKVVGIGFGAQPTTGYNVQTTHVETTDRVTRVFVDVIYSNCLIGGAIPTHPYELLYIQDAGFISVVENFVGTCE